MANNESANIRLLVTELIDETRRVFSTIINKTKESDSRAKHHKVSLHKRHRLHVLLDVAEETKNLCSKNIIVAPWFIAELKSIVNIGKRWRTKQIWKEIEPALVDSTHFTHTMAKLRIAEQLEKEGHRVEIIPSGNVVSPDLTVQAIGGSQEWANIECYQPIILNGGYVVKTSDIEHIVKKSMKKAKKQLGRKKPGILAICGFNQEQTTLAELKELVFLRLQKTNRPNLCGILLVMFSIRFNKIRQQITFTPVMRFEFIPNPSYFGLIDIERGVIQDTLNPAKTVEKLTVIEKPADKTRTILLNQSKTSIFSGNGNIDYICGSCEGVLATKIWKFSLSNIVTNCPFCGSYNEFPKIDRIETAIRKYAIDKIEIAITRKKHLRRGVCIFGL